MTNTIRPVSRGDIVDYHQVPGIGEVFTAGIYVAIVLGYNGLSSGGVQLVDLHIFLPVLSTPTDTDFDETTEIPVFAAVRTNVPYYEGQDGLGHYWTWPVKNTSL